MTSGKRRFPRPVRPARNGRRPLVLVVDDYADNREMYAEFLRFAGFTVLEAKDGYEALAQASATPPDLVVMDLSLPGLDGWEATRRLKADPRTKAAPVIAVTGFALGGHADAARAAGCDLVLTKPCTPEDLTAAIRRLLARPAAPRRRARTGVGSHGR